MYSFKNYPFNCVRWFLRKPGKPLTSLFRFGNSFACERLAGKQTPYVLTRSPAPAHLVFRWPFGTRGRRSVPLAASHARAEPELRRAATASHPFAVMCCYSCADFNDRVRCVRRWTRDVWATEARKEASSRRCQVDAHVRSTIHLQYSGG